MLLKRLFSSLVCLALLVPAALPASENGEEEFVEERRLRLWSTQTGNPDLVYSTYLRIDRMEGTGPGSWVYEWSAIGDYFADRGESLAAAGSRIAARDAFLTTAKFYGIARFPAKTLPGQPEAYLKHLHYYRRAGEFFDPDHSIAEHRFVRVGHSRRERILLVVFCEKGRGSTVRIISARRGTSREARVY